MNKETAARLLALNRQFYQTFALQFSGTRQRIQPGARRILESIPQSAAILDLGCGNGVLARALERRDHKGRYLGLDFSLDLLSQAKKYAPKSMETRYELVDIASPDWQKEIDVFSQSSLEAGVTRQAFQPDFIFAFAILHHLPGDRLRRQFLAQIHDLLPIGSQFVFSTWQFLNSQRLRNRIQPWDEIAIHPEDVEKGDYLLDWRAGGYGLRYVHHFTQQELERLAEDLGFFVSESFYSDGEGSNLGLYQIWIPTSQV